MKAEITWNGLDIEADVYIGSTPSGGPDPSCIENLTIVGVRDLSALDAWLGEKLLDEERLVEALFEEAESGEVP